MELLSDFLDICLEETPIGETNSFIWFATPFGIAALCRFQYQTSTPPYERAIEEGIDVALDLSREEREFCKIEKGLVLVFYS